MTDEQGRYVSIGGETTMLIPSQVMEGTHRGLAPVPFQDQVMEGLDCKETSGSSKDYTAKRQSRSEVVTSIASPTLIFWATARSERAARPATARMASARRATAKRLTGEREIGVMCDSGVRDIAIGSSEVDRESDADKLGDITTRQGRSESTHRLRSERAARPASARMATARRATAKRLTGEWEINMVCDSGVRDIAIGSSEVDRVSDGDKLGDITARQGRSESTTRKRSERAARSASSRMKNARRAMAQPNA
jgi:hypothetical protein